MTVAIVHERYSVVSGQKAIRTDSEKRKKLAIYLSAVLILALVVNLPKFFELTWAQIGQMSFLVPTALRTNPYYSIFYICWTRLIFWKILPHSLLIFFCYKIYRAAQLATSQADNQTQGENLFLIFETSCIISFTVHQNSCVTMAKKYPVQCSTDRQRSVE
jgi:hypothetical protein